MSALALSLLMPLAVLYLPSHTVATLPAGHLQPGAAEITAGGSVAAALWLLGTLGFLMRELLSSVALARWRHQAYPLRSARWASALARLAAEQGFDCRLRVLESTRIASPCVWGVVYPVLLLPAADDAWSESARRSALLHEFAHVRRCDALTALVSRFACAIHWYNPLVWLAAARARSLQERACDDAVLRSGEVPSDYAQCLLDIAEGTSAVRDPGRLVLGMARSSLHERIVAILDPRAMRSQVQLVSAFAACTSMLALMLFLATASVATEIEASQQRSTQPTPRDPAPLPPLPELPKLPRQSVAPIPPVPPTPPIPPVLPTAATPATPPAR
jgi:beta-lactamase regulating signal transducer with metallopeptidase domain